MCFQHDFEHRVSQAAESLCIAAARCRWCGPDPYDALWNDRWPRVLTGGRRRRQALVQLHARSPVDIRRFYRSEHPCIAKALGAFGLAATRLHRLQPTADRGRLALGPLDLLDADQTTGTPAWGYPFPVQTRWSFYPAHAPNVVVTSFAGIALIEGANEFDRHNYQTRAAAASAWVLDTLFDDRRGYFVYHPTAETLIHNANLLGARLVLRALGDDTGVTDAVASAVDRTLEAQRPDGSWPYGKEPCLQWVDSFHTGFVLECLADLVHVDVRVAEATHRGARYYLSHFFGPAGEARLWPGRRFPEDGHAAGSGLSAIAALVGAGVVSVDDGRQISERILSHVVRGDHTVCRRYRFGRTTVRYLRWCDAHVALGLATYALAHATAGHND